MSIALNFRSKWKTIVSAIDESRGNSDDARYAAAFQAADQAGLVLTEKRVIAAYQDKIRELQSTQ